MTSFWERQQKAEAQFHKTIKKAQEAKQAVSEYEANAEAVRKKTARLRALRLAQEAVVAQEAAQKRGSKKRAIAKKVASPLTKA